MHPEIKTLFIYYAPHPIHSAFAETVTSERYPCGVSFSEVLVNFIKGIFKRENYDVLFLESGTCLPVALALKKSKTKIVLLNADPLFFELPKINFLKRKILKFLISYVDVVIVNSQLNKDLASKYFHKKIYTVRPFGLNSNFNINCDIASSNLLFIGNEGEYKGFNSLLEAVEKLNEDKTLYDLYIVGSSADRITSDYDWLHKEGFLHDLDPYFRECSIYIHPAEYESFGASIIEAMAAGLIPIITKNCGASDVFKENNLEFLIMENNNPETIKNKITEIYNQQLPWKKDISKKCKEISLNYTKETQLKKFKNTFDEITTELLENDNG
jgi:glycosyltransferase involved in cell wall biosynthesis